MFRIRLALVLVLGFTIVVAKASPVTPDWSKNAVISAEGRANLYGWDESTLKEKIKLGRIAALNYPVSSTGVLLPARPFLKMLNAKPGNPLFGLIRTVLSLSGDFKGFNGFWEWMGLHNYPSRSADPNEEIPYPPLLSRNGETPLYPMGLSFIERNRTMGMTFGCAACHASELFGKTILGMTNRFPQANSIFIFAQKSFHSLGPGTMALFTGANADEKEMYAETRKNITAIGTKKPATLGLDTALAQVTLSIAKRKAGPWAERSTETEAHPRADMLTSFVADSKPAVWWNTKYKNKWLSDGGVVSGNPIVTNIAWNEIGRGGDLHEVDAWIDANQETIENLTTAVFASTAPKWTEFFGENSIHITRAKQGEKLFVQNCSSCHGHYEKAWSLPPSLLAEAKATNPNLLATDTVKVKYFSQTFVVDVGTDANRRIGMKSIADAVNPLAISEKHNVVNEVQEGYVPPPLEGIFARYPYLHNNSVPSLCALMTKPAQRPVSYISGAPIDRDRDYDQGCVGYPLGAKIPKIWQTAQDASEHIFDTRKSGMTNAGHYEGIFTKTDGSERYTADEKLSLVEFLKSL